MRLREFGIRALWCLVAAIASLCPAMAEPLALSAEERDWVARNPIVEVLVIDGHAPYVQRQADGSAAGYSIEMMNQIGALTGLRWKFRWVASAQEAVQAFRAGTARITPLAAPSPEREQLVSFPGPLLPAEIVLVTRSDVPDASDAQNFAGRRIAVVEASVPGTMLQREFPGAQVVSFRTLPEALKAVSVGQADLAITWLHEALYQIEANLLANLRVRREERAGRTFLGPAVARNEVVLDRLVRKALDRIGPAERAAISQRWLPVGTSVLWVPGQATLTPAEREWVRRAGDVRIGFDREFAPFTSSPSLGRFEGLGADMFRLAAQKVGLRVIEQAGASFADTYARAASGEIDVVVGMARTETRRAIFDFVGPFHSSPTVLVMRSDDARQWRTPDEIDAAELGLLKEHFLIPQLHSRRPSLSLVTFDSQAEALAALDAGRVGVVLGNATVMNRIMAERYTGRLRITGVIPDADSELFFGVNRSRPELTRLLDKGFAAITPGEAAELQRRWILVNIQPGLRWAEVLRWAVPIGLAALLALAVLWHSNRRLRRAHGAESAARLQAEAATLAHRRSETLLNDIATQVPGVVFRYVVRRDGSIAHRYTSPGTAQFLGLAELDPSRSILQEVAHRVREDLRQASLAAETHSMRTGEPFKITVAYQNPGRGEQWLHAEAVQQTSADGSRVWTGYVVDVSPERELQARLTREAESRNLLLASASHELRAPTHALSMALQSVTGRGLADTEARALEIARQSALTLTQLLNDVLDAARFSTDAVKLRPRSFDLHALLAEVSGAWRAAAGSKGLAFELQLAPDLPRRVVQDPLRLKQILTNLLSNACKYTVAGRVRLQAQRDGESALRFVVGDTGIGIAPQRQATMFEPFTAGNDPAGTIAPEGSTGLGLAICRRLATLMGGQVELRSTPGQGTEATLVVPVEPVAAHPAARHGKVLVCDDDPVSRLMMTEMLRRSGFDAEDAGDGQLALARWKRGGVGAIVTDLNMPGLDGRELIRLVREAEAGRDDATAIVVCSGSDVDGGAAPVRCDAYLLKPVHTDILVQTLRDLGL